MPAVPANEAADVLADQAEATWSAIDPAHAGHPVARTTVGDPIFAVGYCLWEFDGAAWILKEDRCKPGAVPSAPPSAPGRFRGQLRAVMAIPAGAAVAEPATTGPSDER